MDEDDLRRRAADRAARTVIEQGLPPRIEDIAVLREILYVLGMIDLEGGPVEGDRTLAHRSGGRAQSPDQ